MMTPPLFLKSAYDYPLPEELIAQSPCFPRDHSRLMIVERKTGVISEIPFYELPQLMKPDDSLVFNNTKVIPARLIGKRSGGGKTEILLLKRNEDLSWNVLAKPGRKLRTGMVIKFSPEFSCEVLEGGLEGSRCVKFSHQGSLNDMLSCYGHLPLPHYIHHGEERTHDKEWYQTIFASAPGASAAPTAGLHFTKELIQTLSKSGISHTFITLHVGLGTFRPVQTEDIRLHPMHSETVSISSQASDQLNSKKNGSRQICVGTTCCRALESAADPLGRIQAGEFETNIFIYPGYTFKYIDALLTNFHLPSSTLLMLVSAFGGYDLIREAYAKAVERKFRFYSYGDAMLIL